MELSCVIQAGETALTELDSQHYLLMCYYDKSYMGPVAVWNANTGVQTGDDKWKTEQEFDNTSTDSAGYQVQLMQSPQPGSHNLIPLSSASNKPCALCKVNNIRPNKFGFKINSSQQKLSMFIQLLFLFM
jgi:hypothetical protein